LAPLQIDASAGDEPRARSNGGDVPYAGGHDPTRRTN